MVERDDTDCSIFRPALGYLRAVGSHDNLVKHAFSDVEHARGVLATALPAAIAARIDWSSLSLRPGSFLGDVLAAPVGVPPDKAMQPTRAQPRGARRRTRGVPPPPSARGE